MKLNIVKTIEEGMKALAIGIVTVGVLLLIFSHPPKSSAGSISYPGIVINLASNVTGTLPTGNLSGGYNITVNNATNATNVIFPAGVITNLGAGGGLTINAPGDLVVNGLPSASTIGSCNGYSLTNLNPAELAGPAPSASRLTDPSTSTNANFVGLGATNVVVAGVTNTDHAVSSPVWTDANGKSVTKTVANAKLALGIQAGTTTLDATGLSGLFTNTVTFPTAFSSPPVVVVQYNIAANYAADHMTNCFATNVTATTFWIGGGVASAPISWIAVGAP